MMSTGQSIASPVCLYIFDLVHVVYTWYSFLEVLTSVTNVVIIVSLVYSTVMLAEHQNRCLVFVWLERLSQGPTVPMQVEINYII